MAKYSGIDHFHITLLALAGILLSLVVLLSNSSTSNAGLLNLQWNKEVTKGQCDTSGSPVINVTQRIINNVDSGEDGNYWAYDTMNREIKVYQIDNDSFCALVDYQGQFDGQPGQMSPGKNPGLLTGKEDGAFKGGYRAIITGALKQTPDLPAKGHLGTTDYGCNLTGSCGTGYFNWVDKYFGPQYTFTYEWWGWEYQYKNLKWINSSDGNKGDII